MVPGTRRPVGLTGVVFLVGTGARTGGLVVVVMAGRAGAMGLTLGLEGTDPTPAPESTLGICEPRGTLA